MALPLIFWRRLRDGYVESVVPSRRFNINPLYYGTARAQGYELHDERTARRSSHDTQRLAKAEAERILLGERK